MLVEERVVDEIVRGLDEPSQVVDEASDVSWFAARQPGIVRYLAARCGEDSDAMAVALHYACAIEKAVGVARGVGVGAPRVVGSLLQRAEAAFLEEASTRGGGSLRGVHGGLADRQPALTRMVADVVDGPPVPLTEFEATRVGVALAAVVYALDEVAFGRPVP